MKEFLRNKGAFVNETTLAKGCDVLIRVGDAKGKKYEAALKYGTKIMQFNEFKGYVEQRLDQ